MKFMTMILFLVIFLGFLVGANVYLAKRMTWYFGIENIRMMYLFFGMLTVFMIMSIGVFTNTVSGLGSLLYGFGAIVMGVMLYLLLTTLVVDLVSLVAKFPPRTHGLIVLSLTALISGYGIWNAFHIRVSEQQIPVKGLQKEIRAMHLTDVHIGHFRGKDFMQKVVDRTNEQQVDVVFMTGDLFDGKIQLSKEVVEPLTKLNAPLYFVEGNHDGYSGVDTIKSYLRQAGIHVLENEVADFGELQVVGLNHMLADTSATDMHAPNGVYATIQEVLPNIAISQERPSVLLHHSPDGVQYAQASGIDLYLAGHTHAGQLFPINLIGELIFAYNKGLHDYKGTKMFVSEGVGTFGPPMRVGTKSEMVLLTLIPSE